MGNLKNEIRKQRSAAKLPQRLCGRMEAKYARHVQSYDRRLDPTARSLMINPGLYKQIGELPLLALFFRSHVAIALSATTLSEELWCPRTEEGKAHDVAENQIGWVKIARYQERLLIDNPLSHMEESWARPSSLSKSRYILHHKIGGSKKKSRFFGNYGYIKPLEYAVFNKGVGQLLAATKMRLYAEFENPIGLSCKGEPLNHMCLEVTREPRPRVVKNGAKRKSGWMVGIHGYPVNREDIKLDFRNTRLSIRRVPKLTNPPG